MKSVTKKLGRVYDSLDVLDTANTCDETIITSNCTGTYVAYTCVHDSYRVLVIVARCISSRDCSQH